MKLVIKFISIVHLQIRLKFELILQCLFLIGELCACLQWHETPSKRQCGANCSHLH